MPTEKIEVRVTESGKTLNVEVLSKRAERVRVVFGEGDHSIICDLTPTRNGSAYAGTVMGREIVYERGIKQVQADIASENAISRQTRHR